MIEQRRISAREIEANWLAAFGIDVSRLFKGVDEVSIRADTETGLEFFFPAIEGDAALYEELQKFSWYYLEDKWEYNRAAQHLPHGLAILEVGCGQGAFLDQLMSAGHDVVGLEMNENAISVAAQRGIEIKNQMLGDFLDGRQNSFDRVYSFQVLEHVSDPVGLLKEMMSAVRSGGRVCFAVPNSDSFVGRVDGILDRPPHHISRWRPDAIRRIGNLVGARSVLVEEGPLEPIHFDWYLRWATAGSPAKKLLRKRYSLGLLRTILAYGVARRIRGHSVYAEYVK